MNSCFWLILLLLGGNSCRGINDNNNDCGCENRFNNSFCTLRNNGRDHMCGRRYDRSRGDCNGANDRSDCNCNRRESGDCMCRRNDRSDYNRNRSESNDCMCGRNDRSDIFTDRRSCALDERFNGRTDSDCDCGCADKKANDCGCQRNYSGDRQGQYMPTINSGCGCKDNDL